MFAAVMGGWVNVFKTIKKKREEEKKDNSPWASGLSAI